jgi:TRAP-type C4-dicarboxylate transport system permease small subunit
MRTTLSFLHRLLNWLLALSVAVLIVPVLLQIFSRYVGFIPRYIWTEEMARFFFIWMIMLGAMIGVREGTHFDVDLLPSMPPKMNAALRMVMHVAILVFALIFVYYGYQFTAEAVQGERTSELADLPLWFIFIAWPLAGVTWLLFTLEKVVAELQLLRRAA